MTHRQPRPCRLPSTGQTYLLSACLHVDNHTKRTENTASRWLWRGTRGTKKKSLHTVVGTDGEHLAAAVLSKWPAIRRVVHRAGGDAGEPPLRSSSFPLRNGQERRNRTTSPQHGRHTYRGLCDRGPVSTSHFALRRHGSRGHSLFTFRKILVGVDTDPSPSSLFPLLALLLPITPPGRPPPSFAGTPGTLLASPRAPAATIGGSSPNAAAPTSAPGRRPSPVMRAQTASPKRLQRQNGLRSLPLSLLSGDRANGTAWRVTYTDLAPRSAARSTSPQLGHAAPYYVPAGMRTLAKASRPHGISHPKRSKHRRPRPFGPHDTVHFVSFWYLPSLPSHPPTDSNSRLSAAPVTRYYSFLRRNCSSCRCPLRLAPAHRHPLHLAPDSILPRSSAARRATPRHRYDRRRATTSLTAQVLPHRARGCPACHRRPRPRCTPRSDCRVTWRNDCPHQRACATGAGAGGYSPPSHAGGTRHHRSIHSPRDTSTHASARAAPGAAGRGRAADVGAAERFATTAAVDRPPCTDDAWERGCGRVRGNSNSSGSVVCTIECGANSSRDGGSGHATREATVTPSCLARTRARTRPAFARPACWPRPAGGPPSGHPHGLGRPAARPTSPGRVSVSWIPAAGCHFCRPSRRRPTPVSVHHRSRRPGRHHRGISPTDDRANCTTPAAATTRSNARPAACGGAFAPAGRTRTGQITQARRGRRWHLITSGLAARRHELAFL